MNFLKVIADFTGMKEDDIKKNVQKEDGTFAEAAEAYITDLLKSKADKLVFTDEKKKEMAENFERKGFAEAMKQTNSKLAELYPKAEITQDMKLDEVVKVIKTQKIEPMPEDQIKLHPIYRDLEKNTIPKTEYEKKVQEFEGFKKDITRKQMLGKVEKMAEQLLNDYKMPDDAKLKQKRMEAFISQTFAGFDLEQDGDDLLLLRDGKRYEDDKYNAITASRRILEQADIFFDRKVKGTPPGTPPPGKNDPELPVNKEKEPLTVEEYTATAKTLQGKELVEYAQKYRAKFRA